MLFAEVSVLNKPRQIIDEKIIDKCFPLIVEMSVDLLYLFSI